MQQPVEKVLTYVATDVFLVLTAVFLISRPHTRAERRSHT